jgi:hypothetical protein
MDIPLNFLLARLKFTKKKEEEEEEEEEIVKIVNGCKQPRL